MANKYPFKKNCYSFYCYSSFNVSIVPHHIHRLPVVTKSFLHQEKHGIFRIRWRGEAFDWQKIHQTLVKARCSLIKWFQRHASQVMRVTHDDKCAFCQRNVGVDSSAYDFFNRFYTRWYVKFRYPNSIL